MHTFAATLASLFIFAPDIALSILANDPECGVPSSTSHSRIANGVPAALGAWPWMAALILCLPDKCHTHRKFQCGGALISKQHVITAAHCIPPKFDDWFLTAVRLGDLNLDPEVDDGAVGTEVLIKDWIPNPGFESDPIIDIAILTLTHAVEYTKLIRPICLPTLPELRSASFEGKHPFVVGWGSVYNSEIYEDHYSFTKAYNSNALLETQVFVKSPESCGIGSQEGTGNQKQLCTAGGIKGQCGGDSGGPLMLPHKDKFYLIGIVSRGINCGQKGYRGFFTRVTTFIDWISDSILD